jgi:PAS domain S-box-containing protein
MRNLNEQLAVSNEQRKTSYLGVGLRFALLLCSLLIVSCAPAPHSPLPTPSITSPFASFRDIPGVTEEETLAIEALRSRYDHFVYGMPSTTEAFLSVGGNGEVRGFSALFCEWLTDLFQISFRPTLYTWGDLIAGLERRDISFTGDLMATEERQTVYFMTDAIAQRSLSIFRMAGAPSLPLLASSRPLRFAFLNNSAAFASVAAVAEWTFEPVFVNDSSAAYEALASGEADAFLSAGISEASFIAYGDLVSEIFFPMVYNSVSLSTQNPELAPFINVVQKSLQHSGTQHYLDDLYQTGNDEYRKNKLFTHLSTDELAYIENNKVIKFAAEIDNYPISFYSIHENEWQGVAHEVLAEVEKLTGLTFEIVTPPKASWPVVLNMLERGEVALISELVRTDEREGLFLWPKTAIMEDRAVLLSRFEYPNITLGEVLHMKVGVIRNSAYAELFRHWFPDRQDILEYDGLNDLLGALERGEIEMMMGRLNQFLNIINYREILGYKINVVFDSYFKSSFGLHKDETVLCSILDKSLGMIDTESIALNWTYKAHDYRYKLIAARLPWLIGAAALLLVTLVLILVLFYRSRGEGKRLAKIVAEETSTLTAILDATPDHVFCKNLDLRYTRFNKSFKTFYNLRGSDIGKFGSNDLGMPSDLAEYHKSMDKKVIATKEMIVSEVLIPSHEGMSTLFEVIKSPLLQDGEVTGLVGMARDITRRKAAEEEAKRASAQAMKAYAEAENASEAKSSFIANMSHEMRTPMNVIVGLTDLMLEDDNAPDSIKETMKKINTAGNTLMGLINDVLDISKVEAGKLELIPVQYETASLLNDIITLNMIRTEDKPVTFKLSIENDLPASLFGDDLRVKQILNNLLSNAFKYTNKGTITLGVSSQRDNGSVWMSYCVSDTGIGIRREDIAKLFTDYNQVDTRANREIKGTGLGLSITKKFVELMDGEISVESEYGKGTLFRVRIRQGFVTDKLLGRETAENLCNLRYSDRKRQAQRKLLRSDLSYAKVLVVDDFPANLEVAAGMLRKYKMQVDCVTSGQGSVDLIAAGVPVYDAIFMDHMMPGMDGIEAVQAIRALGTEYAKKVPIIALTANVVAGNEQMFLDNGFNAFLPKPFNVMLLDSVIKQWVRQKRN